MNKSSAFMDGWFAHKQDLVTADNPYNENTQMYSYMQWLSGWCGRFDAIKHNLDLSLDDKLYD